MRPSSHSLPYCFTLCDEFSVVRTVLVLCIDLHEVELVQNRIIIVRVGEHNLILELWFQVVGILKWTVRNIVGMEGVCPVEDIKAGVSTLGLLELVVNLYIFLSSLRSEYVYGTYGQIQLPCTPGERLRSPIEDSRAKFVG